MKALVYVAALAPDEGETVADVFTRGTPHPQAPKLAPDAHGLMYLPEAAFAAAFAQNASKEELAVLAPSSAQSRPPASLSRWSGLCGGIGRPGSWSPSRTVWSSRKISALWPNACGRTCARTPSITRRADRPDHLYLLHEALARTEHNPR